METTVVLSRKMGEYEVTQRTSDGYFDANALLNQWNAVESNTRRRIDKFFESENTSEFIEALRENLWSKNTKAENQLFTTQKGRMTMKGRTPDKVWMHPYLFIKFAMWINPRHEVSVIKFVYDELIKHRNDAGDAYRLLCEAVAKISNKKDVAANIQTTAKALNHICFGMHETMLRNKQGESAMKDLVELEKYITNLITDGVLTNWTSLYNFLVRKYNERRVPKVFQQQLQA